MNTPVVASLLRKLVSGDHRAALDAARTLSSAAMIVSGDDADPVSPLDTFSRVVQRAVAARDFDLRSFGDALYRTLQAAQADRMAAFEREDARFDAVADRLAKQIEQAGSDAEREAARQELFDAVQSDDDPDGQLQSELMEIELAAGLVYNALGDRLVTSSDVLQRTLADPKQAYLAYQTIAGLGPAAREFAPTLLDHVSANRWDLSLLDAAVAALGGSPPLIRTAIERWWAQPCGYPSMLAALLAALGPQCAAADPQLPGRLLAATRSPDSHRVIASIVALGGVTADMDVAVDRLLELTGDGNVIVQGCAITALGQIARQPERVVPRLIALLSEFEEFDTDMAYGGPCARVAAALAAFGPAAAPATGALAARIRPPGEDDDTMYDGSVIEALTAIGPAAAAALPPLEALLAAMGEEAADTEPVKAAIARIRGQRV